MFNQGFLEGLEEWLGDLASDRKKAIEDSFSKDKLFIEEDEGSDLSPKKKKKKTASKSPPPSPKKKKKELSPPLDREEEVALIVEDLVSKVASKGKAEIFLPGEEEILREGEQELVVEDLDLKKVEQFDKDHKIRQVEVTFEDPQHLPETFEDKLDPESWKPLPKCIEEGIVRDLYRFQIAAVNNMIKLAKELKKDPTLLFKGNLLLHDTGTGKTLIIDAVVECLLTGYVDKAYIVTTSKVKKQLLQSLKDELNNYQQFKDRIEVINFESFAKANKKLEEVEKSCERSLLVIDEAHRLRNLETKKGKGKKKAEEKATFTKRIERCAMGSAIVLLATATPYFKSIQDIYSLLSLIFNPNNKYGISTFSQWIQQKKKGLSPVEIDGALSDIAKQLIDKYGFDGYYKRILIAPEIEKAHDKRDEDLADWAKDEKSSLETLYELLNFEELKDHVSIYKFVDYNLLPDVIKKLHFIDSLSGSDNFVKLYKSQGKKSWKEFLQKYDGAPETAPGKEFSAALRGTFAIPDNKGVFFYSPKLKVIYDILQPTIDNNKKVEEELKKIDDPLRTDLYKKKHTKRTLFKVSFIDNLNLLQQFLIYLGLEGKISVISGEKNQKIQETVQQFESGAKPYVIITQAGQEGLDFKAIHDLIVVDIPYTWSDLIQIFGRGIRVNSHANVDEKLLNVHLLILSNFEENKPVELKNLISTFKKKSQKLPAIDTLLFVKALERRYIGDAIFEILNRFSIQHQEIVAS